MTNMPSEPESTEPEAVQPESTEPQATEGSAVDPGAPVVDSAQQVPSQPFPSQPFPGQQFPSQQFPGQQFPAPQQYSQPYGQYGQPFGQQQYGQPGFYGAYPGGQPQAKSSTPWIIGGLALLLVAALGVGAFFLFKDDSQSTADDHAPTSTQSRSSRTTPKTTTETSTSPTIPNTPSGLPSEVVGLLPAAMVPALSNCTTLSRVYYEDNGPSTTGYMCDMTLEGINGHATMVHDPQWVTQAYATREQRPGYRAVTVPNYTSYDYTWTGGQEPTTVQVLIDEPRALYFDVEPRDASGSLPPTPADAERFRAAFLALLGA